MQISQPDASAPTNTRTGRVRVGDRVRVRHQRWVVTERRSFDDCEALSLTGIGPANAGSAGTLRTGRSAHMDLLPYQLEPALAIVHGRGTRMLIADEVGLGKTVQAALIVAELKARAAISRVLVLTPAGLREQWIDEFLTRFDLPLTLFDVSTAARRRASLPVGVNPWSVEPF